MTAGAAYTRIDGPAANPNREKVVASYADDPQAWRKALGGTLMFEWGSYEGASRPLSAGEAGVRFFEQQLELAGLLSVNRPPVRRILDLGCGWGFESYLLARWFPECPRIDGVNLSEVQLEHCAQLMADHGLSDRVNLYLCDGADVDLLPDPGLPYDLVVVRGVFTHFPNTVYERAVQALARRVTEGGLLVISDNFYHCDVDAYTPEIPDPEDRLGCNNRKTSAYFTGVLKDHGFAVQDLRVLPSNADGVRWFQQIKDNIDAHFTGSAPRGVEETRNMAANMILSLPKNKLSAYSVIARRTG